MVLDLDAVLGNAVPSSKAREATWKPFGFLRNPFPSRAHPIWDVFHNQEPVKGRFLADLAEFMRESNTITLFFTGGNRVGKTHFMEHHRQELTAKVREYGVVMPTVVVSAQACDFRSIYGQMVDQIDDSLHLQTGTRLFGRAIAGAHAAAFSALPVGDFKRALERASHSDSQESLSLLRRWLRGDRIRAPQRALLNVTSLVDATPQMLNALESLVKFLLLDKEEQDDGPSCAGILVFIDEFELVWRARRDRRDQFLQALRALIDACPKGLYLVVGMATGLSGLDVDVSKVEDSYPALFQRLVGIREIPALLQIQFFSDAIGYARAFLNHARREFRRLHTGEEFRELFSDQEIEVFFREIGGGGTVSQGDFFDRLHVEAEDRVQRAS